MSLTIEKLEASLVWASEKYGPDAPLVRSLTEQLRVRLQESTDQRELDHLTDELRGDVAAEDASPATQPVLPNLLNNGGEEPGPSDVDSIAQSLTIEALDEEELPHLQIGERVGRRHRDC